MPALVEAIRQTIERELEDRPVLVWYDAGAALRHVAELLADAGTRLIVYDGSFLALRAAFEEADPALRDQTIIYVGRERPEPSWLRDLELAGSCIRLGLAEVISAGFGLATTAHQRELLAGPLGKVLAARWDELMSAQPSPHDLDRAMLAAALGLGAHPGLRDMILHYVVQDDAPERVKRAGLQGQLRTILEAEAGLCGLPEGEVPQRRVAAALLLSEAASRGAIAIDQIGQEVIPSPRHLAQWTAWAEEWMRWQDDGSFVRWSEDVSQQYRIRDRLTGPTLAVARVQAFRAVDDECVQRVGSLVRSGELTEARRVAELRRSTRWTKRAEAVREPLPWEAMVAALTLLEAARAACSLLDARATWTLPELLARYADEWWKIDDANRQLEANWSTAQGDLGEFAVIPASRAYAHFLDVLSEAVAGAVDTLDIWAAEGWSSPRETAVRYLGNGSHTALILADALRSDLARVVVRRLQEQRVEVEEVRTLAELPSVTEVGMAAIQVPPWNERELALEGRPFPKIGGTVLRNRQDRLAALRTRFPRAQDIELDTVNTSRTIPSAQPLVVYAQAIDDQGGSLPDIQLDILELLACRIADATRRLLDQGYRTVLIIPDHGFILSPRAAPVPTVPAPRTDASTVRKHRYALGRPSDVDGAVRIPLRRLGWQDDGSALFPRGRGVFALQGGTPRFFHGGPLPQETALLSLVCRRVASGMPPTSVRIVEPTQIVTAMPHFVLRGESDSLFSTPRRVRVVIRVESRVVAESDMIEIEPGEERSVLVRLDRYGREVHAIVEDVESRDVVTEQIIPVELPAGYEDLGL